LMSGESKTLMKTLEDFHAYQTLLSDETSFKATL